MPESGSEHPVLFLSHAGVDAEPAHRLKERIQQAPQARARNLKVWFDKDDLHPGESWQQQLEEAIGQRATAFAVYIGARGVVNWVEAEVRLGLSRAISGKDQRFPFIPILAAGSDDSQALPGFARQFQGVREVETNPDEFRKLVSAVLGEADAGTLELETEPFFGLKAIDETRSHLFFGRERETQELVERLSTRRLLMVTGDSGSGKSSLVRAGLTPRWRGGALAELRGKRPDEEIWHVVEARPRGNPRRALGEAVFDAAKRLGRIAADCATYMELAASGDPEKARHGLRCGLHSQRTRTLLVVDQLEELWTLTASEPRHAFVELLLDLADLKDENFAVVLTMRRDYYNLCSDFAPLYSRLEAEDRQARYLLGRMRDENLRRVVTEPLKLAGVNQGDREALASSVLRDVGERPGDLALVQFALTEAWRQRGQHQGDLLQTYAAVGRVEGALARAAEAVYTTVLGGDKDSTETEAVFIRLVRLGDTGGATRRLAHRREFNDQRWALLQTLAREEGNRLVLISGVEGEERAEIAHEALVTQWPRYQRWLQAAAGDKRTLDELIERAARWATQSTDGNREAMLATGVERDAFSQLAATHRIWLSDDEIAFVEASDREHEAQSRAARARARWTRVAAAAFAVLFIIAAGLAWWGNEQRLAAEQNFETAKLATQEISKRQIEVSNALADAQHQAKNANMATSRHLARLSIQKTAAGDATAGILLALEALPRDRLDPRPLITAALAALTQATINARERAVVRHDGLVSAVALTPDGRTLSTVTADGVVRIWDVATGAEKRAALKHDSLESLAFSPDGRMLVTASRDGTARLWNLSTGHPIVLAHEHFVRSATFSPDSATLVTTSDDKTARVWNVATGQRGPVLRGHENTVRSAAFSKDSRIIATGSDDRTARIWNVESGQEQKLFTHQDPDSVTSVAFSPDDRALATASGGTARLWDIAAGEERIALAHRASIGALAFSSDGRTVTTATLDNRVYTWDVATGQELTVSEQPGLLRAVALAPDGLALATAFDGTAQVWNVARARERVLASPASVKNFAFAPDGRTLAIVCEDNTVLIWDVKSDEIRAGPFKNQKLVGEIALSADGRIATPAPFDGTVRIWDMAAGSERGLPHQHGVKLVTFAPNGRMLATATLNENAVRVWDTSTGLEEAALIHLSMIETIALSSSGKTLASVSDDKTVRIWDIGAKKEKLLFSGEDSINSLAFSTDGQMLATTSGDKARIWDVASGQEHATLKHQDTVDRLTFSPEGRILASASADDTVRIWDVLAKRERFRRKHHGTINALAFSPNGSMLASASDDRTARLWDVNVREERVVLTYQSPVTSVAFSPDGRTLAIASTDKTARLIELPPNDTWDLINDAREKLPVGRGELTASERQDASLEAANIQP
jgi:WD40 repeat protein